MLILRHNVDILMDTSPSCRVTAIAAAHLNIRINSLYLNHHVTVARQLKAWLQLASYRPRREKESREDVLAPNVNNNGDNQVEFNAVDVKQKHSRSGSGKSSHGNSKKSSTASVKDNEAATPQCSLSEWLSPLFDLSADESLDACSVNPPRSDTELFRKLAEIPKLNQSYLHPTRRSLSLNQVSPRAVSRSSSLPTVLPEVIFVPSNLQSPIQRAQATATNVMLLVVKVMLTALMLVLDVFLGLILFILGTVLRIPGMQIVGRLSRCFLSASESAVWMMYSALELLIDLPKSLKVPFVGAVLLTYYMLPSVIKEYMTMIAWCSGRVLVYIKDVLK